MYKYSIKRLGDCIDSDIISVDETYTIQGVASMILAHNSGLLDISEECWFGNKESYQFAPDTAIAIVREDLI